MLEITFLGTSGSIPTTERGMPALALKYESDLMLWDCGEGTQRQMMRYKVGYGSISQVCITHPHLDHYLGLSGLLETMKLSAVSPKKVSVHCPEIFSDAQKEHYPFVDFSRMRKGMLYKNNNYSVSAFPVRHCRGSYGLMFEEAETRKFHEKKAHSLGLKGKLFREIQQKGQVSVEGKKVTLDEVTWLRQGRKIVYSGDGRPSDTTAEAARGADLLIHEGTFDSSKKAEAEERLHCTVAEAAGLAKKAKVSKLIITHVSPRYSDNKALEEEAQKIFPGTSIAYDGMKVSVPLRK
ncbi:MAG: ribonuclease Z [Candidatus Micrarchaeota archaeon]